MNHKSIAITSALFALTLAVPPPFNSFMGTSMFLGLKMYRVAVLFFGVTIFFYSPQIIALVTSNRFEQILETQDVVSHQIANATMADPSLFPYVGVALVTSVLLELFGLFILLSPIYIIRKKVYPHIKNRL